MLARLSFHGEIWTVINMLGIDFLCKLMKCYMTPHQLSTSVSLERKPFNRIF